MPPPSEMTAEAETNADLLVFADRLFTRTEKKRDAPQSGKRDYRVYDARKDCVRTAEYPCHDVKSEKSDASPVESADNGNNKGYPVNYHMINSLFCNYILYFSHFQSDYTYFFKVLLQSCRFAGKIY